MPDILISLTPSTSARMELMVMERTGLYRLTVDHPATRLVEYFKSSGEALARWGELHAVLSGALHGDDDLTPAA